MSEPDRDPRLDQPGFLVFESHQVSADGQLPTQVANGMVYNLYDPAHPCPCGSARVFGACCLPLGARRLLVARAGGGYAPALVHRETWSDLPFADVRARLLARADLWCSENTLLRCFWHHRPGGQCGRQLFGTLALTPDGLVLEAMSRPRYLDLRGVLAQALGALPAGRRQVRYLADAPAGEPPPAGAVDEPPVLELYEVLRARLPQLHAAAGQELLREEIRTAARHLGMLTPAGSVALETEQHANLLFDYALYEVRRHGRPVISQFMARRPPADETDRLLYGAMAANRLSLFRIEQLTPEGLLVRDLLAPDRPPVGDLLPPDRPLVAPAGHQQRRRVCAPARSCGRAAGCVPADRGCHPAPGPGGGAPAPLPG